MHPIDLLKRLAPSPIKELVRPRLPRGLRAKYYVGTEETCGQLQFELLRREGCRPNSKVLEIGCGRLHASVPLIRYLDKGNYVGVDPNEWLRLTAMKDRRVRLDWRLIKAQPERSGKALLALLQGM